MLADLTTDYKMKSLTTETKILSESDNIDQCQRVYRNSQYI